MRTVVAFGLVLVSFVSARASENSILYPRQIQPKLSLREKCAQGGEWKKYGSRAECVAEKRHEELVELHRRQLEQADAHAAADAEDRRRLRAELQQQQELEMLREAVRTATQAD